MTRAFLRDTRSFSYRSVARHQYTVIGQVIVDTRRFSGSECYTLNTILDLRQLTLGIGKLVNRCFADLEVYMPNDQS